MSVRATVDQSNWIELPGAFPTEDAETEAAWLDQALGMMRAAWPHGLDATTERAVRDELAAGLASVRPGDSLTLQYWPWFRPVSAVVHIVFAGFDDDGDRPAYLLGDGQLSASPAFEVVTAEHLGDGVEVRMLSRPEGLSIDVAGLTQLYVSGDRFVGVGVDATLPAVLAVMLPDLRDLLDTIEIVDDDGRGPWARAEVAVDAIPEQGETWSAAPREESRA